MADMSETKDGDVHAETKSVADTAKTSKSSAGYALIKPQSVFNLKGSMVDITLYLVLQVFADKRAGCRETKD